MDDKDDPYNKSYSTKPPLPPFSSLRPCSSALDGSYGAPELDRGYGASLSPYQQQQQLYSFNPHLQGHPSQYHQQPHLADFPHPGSAAGLQRSIRPSHLRNCQSSSFHGSSTQGSHFQIKDQSQFLTSLQHPPIPDMSLSLPFSSGQPGMLGRSHLPIGIQSFSDGRIYRSNTDQPPQIPLSQVESLLSEAEQKSISDFSALPQSLENRDMNSSWQSSYNSGPAQSSEQLSSFSNISSFYSGTSNTKDVYFNSELQRKEDSYNRYRIPESINSFTTPTSSLPGYSSQYQLPGSTYSGNCFLPKHASRINSSDIPFSNFSGVANSHGEQNSMFHMTAQSNQVTSRSGPQETYSIVADQTPMTKGGRKGRKKKKMSEKSLDTEVKSLTRKKKPKTLKKAKCQPTQEPLALLPSMNSDNDSVSSSFCLSPTFIASLSSKRANDPQLSDAPHSGLCVSQQNNIPQISHSIPGSNIASLQSFHVSESNASYFAAPAACQSTVSSSSQFRSTGTSQMSYASIRLPSAKSSCQGSYSRNEPHIFSLQASPIYTPNINTECKPSNNLFNEAQVETEEEEKSLSPFRLSPGFIASLSSKRAESHPVQKSLMETALLSEPPLESHRQLAAASCGSKYPFLRHPAQTSEPLSADRAHNELPYSSFPSSFVKQAIPPPRIQLFDKPELYTPWSSSFQKPSLSQECNFKNMPRHACSPKHYVSPPAYAQGSEFQYPTPPMDDEESKLQSPGLCISPNYLDSLSNKIASGELSHRLSPSHDDSVLVLPTPPNSAGPKQPYMPDITLSKEEQTSRILEIIAREREKVSATYQSSPVEPKKKKKKKKSNDLGSEGDVSKLMSNELSKQMEQHIYPYCSESSADNDCSYQKYPEMPNSLSDQTSCYGKLGNNTAITDDNGAEASLNYQFQLKHIQQQQMMLQENDGGQFDSKEEKPKFRFDNPDSFRIGDMCNKNEIMQRHLDNLQTVEGQNHTSMSPKINVISFNKHLYRSPYSGTCQNSSSVNHFPIRMPDSTPKMFEKDLVKADPYAFDDSEQADMIVSMTRNMKPVQNLPCIAQTKRLDAVSMSHLSCALQTKPMDISVSNVPFIARTKPTDSRPLQPSDQHFYSANQMLTAEDVHSIRPLPTQQIWGKTNHPQRSHQIQPDQFIENELLSSQSHSHEVNPNSKCHIENQHKLQLINSTAPIMKDQHYHSMQHVEEQKSLKNASGMSFCSEGTIIKQESQNMQQMADPHKSFPDSFSTLNGHVSDILKHEVNESLSMDVVKKKRGRPPKHASSTSPSPAKPKMPKLKLHEKKLKIQAPKKLVYRLNGTEVSSRDLNLNQNLVDRLANNLVEVADCSCLGPDHIPSETTEGPYYTQLGAARDIPGVRKVLEQRTGISGSAIRIEKVIFTGKEGKSKEGCPIAKWIVRRSGPDEKYLCIVRKRPGHFCDTAVIIMVIVAWEGVDQQQADTLYDFLISTLPQNGLETDRRCGLNEKKTCACQGVDLLRRGASFSFGCSWSMYYNGCKFARSQMARKFKLKDVDCEDEIEDKLQKLATDVAPLYSRLAPDAFRNQTQFEKQAHDCRLGKQPGRPFSGVTAVVDFCCHSHRDCHNMNNGSTVVVNLTKHRGFEKPEDEQYHVLPLYILDQTDEHGTMEGQMAKVRNGSLEVLSRYMTQVRRRSTPYRPCQRNRTTPKKQGLKKSPKKSKLIKAKSFPRGDYPDETFSKSENSSFSDDGFLLPQSPSVDKVNKSNGSRFAMNMVPGVGLDDRNPENMSYTDLMSQQGTPGFGDLYAKFWDYFYTHGEFPPCEWMSKKRFSATSKAASSSLTSDTLIQPTVAGQMFLRHQQWQHQEQRRLQQHNVQNQAGQSQQQENQRQQNLPSCLTGKQDFYSPSLSPQLQYPQTSPRQQHHSHSYQCETPVPKSPQASSQLPLHPSLVISHQGAASQKIQSHNPSPVPISIPLTSSKLQQHPSESSSPSDLSHFISSTPTHQSEASRSSLPPFGSHPDHFHRENSVFSLHPSSKNSPTFSQNPAIMPHAPSEGCDEHSVKPPPSYHQSVSNQHNMQCGPPEVLCSFKPQGPSPPSYCESLAQSAHNIIVKLNDSQGDMHALRFSSNNSRGGPQLGPHLQSFNQSVQYPSPGGVIHTQLDERYQFQSMLQRSFSSNSHDRPPSTQSGSELLVPRPLSTKSSEQQSSELQRPPSSQSSPRSISIQSTERQLSLSCSSSVQVPSGLAQSLQKPYSLHTSGSYAAQVVKRPASAMSVPKPISEQSTSRSLSLQFFERRQSFNSVDGSQPVQREQKSPSSHSEEMSPSHSITTSGHWLMNQQQCCRKDSNGADSSIEKSSIEHKDSNSLKKFNSNFTGNRESCMSDARIMSSEMQVKSGRERSWSRMSEPTTAAEVARPSSCSSEPGRLSGWRTELPFNVTASDILRGKHNLETWPSAGPSIMHPSLENSKNTHSALNSDLKDREFGSKQEASNIKESSWLAQSEMLKACGNNLQQSYLQGKERIPHKVNYGGFINGQQAGAVCPNGPVIGEKMKVHKSEGFVVPKLGQGPSEPPYEVIDSTVATEEIDDNQEAFNDPAMGGVAIALCHGAVLFEVAKRELHATTALKEPNRYQPKRISLVFYQHKNLNLSRHGFDEYERKIEERRSQAEQARLIEEMESKGFLKGELSELASFPNLTKGTFGKVFNFPESRETMFPLRFPRYLDCSHSEQITPVMFACMSIAFPKYMKEAFPNPAKLPRLISGNLPARMHSSLPDRRRDFRQTDSETDNKELQFLVDNSDKNGDTFQRVLSPWNPNIPQENTMTTDRVITRWVHEDVSVTGPYNRWVELILQDTIKKEEVEAESEADLKEKMFESLSQLDNEAYISNRDMSTDSFKYSDTIMKTCNGNQNISTTTMVINLEPTSSDLDHSAISGRSPKKEIELKPSSVDDMAHNATSKNIPKMPKAVNISSDFSQAESQGAVDNILERYTHHGMFGGRMQPDPTNNFVLDGKIKSTEKTTTTPATDTVTLLRSRETTQESFQNFHLHSVPGYSQISARATTEIQVDESSSSMDLIRKSAIKDENLNHTENAVTGCQMNAVTECQTDAINDAPGYISGTGNPCNQSSRENYPSKVENKFEENVHCLETKRRENVYDFLMKGLNRSFLSSQPNGAQDMQDEFPSALMKSETN